MEKKKVGYSIATDILQQFEEKADLVGITPSKFVEGCMSGFCLGEFDILNGRPYFKGTQVHVPRETYTPVHPTERKKPGPKPSPKPDYGDPMHDSTGKSLMPEDWDHEKMTVDQYPPAPVRPLRGAEDQPCLLWATKGLVTGQTFEDACCDFWVVERIKTTEREWEGGKMAEYVARSANRFLLMNRMQNLWFCPDLLEEGMYSLRDQWQDIVVEQYKYDGKEYV